MSKTLLAAAALTLLPVAVPAVPASAADTVALESLGSAARIAGEPHRAAQVAGGRKSSQSAGGLEVSLQRISPAYLQPGERITVSGKITNLDDSRWGDLQVYLIKPVAAAVTTDDVAAMAASPALTVDGERITKRGYYQELGGLDPGSSVRFELSVPFRLLELSPDSYGVYTLTVQVRGNDPVAGRVTGGRARSLIPLMPADSPLVRVSTIWPFRAKLARGPDGEYEDPEKLIDEVSPGGRLRRLLNLARTSGSATARSLLIDPALLDALHRIVVGNPARPKGPPSPSESPTATTEGAAADSARSASAGQPTVSAFLDDLTNLGSASQLWAEGYGGPDLAAFQGYDSSRLCRTITRATASTLSQYELVASRVYVPAGAVDPAALAEVGPKTSTLVSSDQIRRWDPSDGPIGIVRGGGNRARVIVADAGLMDGGPRPGPTDTPLQIRQRLLAESAVLSLQSHADARRKAPSLVFLADDNWNPGPRPKAADFFSAFDAPWMLPTSLTQEIVDGPRHGARHLRARHHVKGTEQPLPTSLLRDADRIRGRGVIMYAITRDDRRLLNFYDETASLAVSEQWRADPEHSEVLADETIDSLDKQLGGVTIDAPEFVTLSSSSGQFPLTITNDLAWPLRVGVKLKAEDGLTLTEDQPIDVDPHQSTTVNVRVDATDVGVSEVTARLTTPKGRPFGEPVTFNVRSSVVGTVIWIALGAAGAVIVLAFGRRILRSARARSVSDGDAARAPGEAR